MFIRIIVVHLLKQKQIIMNKTKYIKVQVSEMLPDESGKYNTDCGLIDYSCHTKIFFSNNVFNYPVGYWLEEVPDREQEMKDIIESLIYELEHSRYAEDTEESIMKAKELLNTLK